MSRRNKRGRPKKIGRPPNKPAMRKIKNKGYILVDAQIVAWQAKRRAVRKAAELANPESRVHKTFKSQNPPKRIKNIFTFE